LDSQASHLEIFAKFRKNVDEKGWGTGEFRSNLLKKQRRPVTLRWRAISAFGFLLKFVFKIDWAAKQFSTYLQDYNSRQETVRQRVEESLDKQRGMLGVAAHDLHRVNIELQRVRDENVVLQNTIREAQQRVHDAREYVRGLEASNADLQVQANLLMIVKAGEAHLKNHSQGSS
jgi:hypothetical protein